MHAPDAGESLPKASQVLEYVLDSYAVLAYLNREEGADVVADLIARTSDETRLFLSVVNLGEVGYIVEREHGEDKLSKTLDRIRRLPIVFVGVDERTALAAAHVKANHRVSYADAFVIALAQESKATVVTGDPEFRSVDKKVDILWLREPNPKREISDRKTARERRAAYRGKPKRKG